MSSPSSNLPEESQQEQQSQIIDESTLTSSSPTSKLHTKKSFETSEEIRQHFLSETLQPYYFCSYSTFLKVFGTPSIQSYKKENLGIIDVHLKYNQYIHEKLIALKWVPSLIVTIGSKLHPLGIVFPYFWVKFIDAYFKDFMMWKESSERIINLRNEFAVKLCKERNKARRTMLFERLKGRLGQESNEIPEKFIKFGEPTPYIFHTRMEEREDTSFYLTTLFENYMWLKSLSFGSLKELKKDFDTILESFKIYKNLKEKEVYPSPASLIGYKEIKSDEVYNLSQQMELRIGRLLELWNYERKGEILRSGFKMTDLVHLNKHYDLLSKEKFSNLLTYVDVEGNSADFVLFYGSVAIVKGLVWIAKRAVKL